MPESFKDLIVVIPGILGSRLVRKDGKHETTVWDLSIKGLPKALWSLVSGGLTLANPDRPPDDGVIATELYSFQLLPGLIGVDDYVPLVSQLRKAVSDPRQLISFPYDWRGSNRFAAERLKSVALDALNRWRETSGHGAAKLWLICHSMGGLVARYFCEHLDGAKDTRTIVTFGTPHRGAAKALNALSNGLKIGPIDVSRMVRSLPSAYELLPLYPVVRMPAGVDELKMLRVADFFGMDPVTGEDVPTTAGIPSLPGLDRAMLQRALQFHAAIRVPAEQRARDNAPSPYVQRAFFNRRQPTVASSFLTRAGLEMYETFPELGDKGGVVDQRYLGDGTVPAFSAVPIEWPDTADALALTDKHAAMQCAADGLDTLFNWLSPLSVGGKKGARDDDRHAPSVDMPSTVALGDALTITLKSPVATPLTATIEHADSSASKSVKVLLAPYDVPRQVQLKPNAIGAWRVVIQPEDRMRPAITDWIYVFDR